MKTLALLNGDLMVGAGGHATVSGVAKIRLSLALAFGEYFGNDRFHPTEWGSITSDYIGKPIDLNVEADVRQEVARVLAQYIAIQNREVYQDYLSGQRSRFAANDIIREVTDIQTRIFQTSILLSVTLRTLANTSVTLNRTVAL